MSFEGEMDATTRQTTGVTEAQMCHRCIMHTAANKTITCVQIQALGNHRNNRNLRERESQQDETIGCLLSTLSEHVSGIIMPIFRRTKTVCYCMRCAALVLLDVVGSGCGALRCGVRAL